MAISNLLGIRPHRIRNATILSQVILPFAGTAPSHLAGRTRGLSPCSRQETLPRRVSIGARTSSGATPDLG
eukprot:2451895-Prymnesium_polylepis.1